MLLFLTALLTQCDNVIDNNNDTGDSPSTDEPALITPVDRATNQALSVEFNWKNYNGIDAFRFQLSENAVFSSTVKDTVTGDRTILVNSLHPNKRYYWKIFPLNPSVTSKWSETRTFQTGSDDIKPVITDLKAPEKGSIITPNELLFTWESISEADLYYLQIAEDLNFNESLIDSLLSTEQFTTQNLELDNAYQWRVTPVSETITGHWSEISEFKLVSEEDLEANIVTLLQPENESTQLETEITLEWEKVDDYETYLLQLTATDNFNDPLIDKFIDASTYTATDLENGTEYRWRVKPHSDNLVYPWSNVWSFSTKDELQIPKLTLKSPENQTEDVPVSVTFSWNAEDGFTEYQFQLADNNSFSNPISDESMSNSSLKVEDLDEETTYYWRARIIHDDKKGAWSEIWSFTTEAGEIEIPRVSLVSPGNGAEDLPTEVEFSWEKADGFDNYRFQLADNSNFSDRIENSVVEGESISVKDLRNDQTFYWRVRIVHDGNNGPWSSVRSFTTEKNEIEIPKVVLSSPESGADDLPTDVEFSWEKADGFENYRFQLADNSNFSDRIENSVVEGESIRVKDLRYSKTYYWRVRIVHDGNNGPWSSVRMFTTEEEEIEIPKVVLSSPESGADDLPTEVEFSWEKADGFENYRFQLADNSNFSSPAENKTVSGSSVTIKDLQQGQTFHWRVRIVHDGNNGPWSDARSFTTKEEEIEIPKVALTSPESGADDLPTEVEFSWEKADGFENYRFQLADNSNFSSPAENKTVTGSSVTVKDLEQGITFYWRVRIVHDGNNGPWSDARSFTTEEEEIEIPKVVLSSPESGADDLPTEVEFSWEKADGFENYRFQLAYNSNFSSLAENKTVSGSSVTIKDLQQGQTFHWRVRIVHDGNNGPWSDARSFTTKEEEIEIPKVALSSPENGAEDMPTEVDFSWTPVDGFDNYRFQLAENSNFSDRIENNVVEGETISVEDLRHDQNHYWRVRIVQNGDNGPWSDVRSFRTEEEEIIIPRVTLVSPSNNASDIDTEITFEWNEEAGFSDYRFQLSQNSNFSSPIENKTVQGSSVVVSGLENGRTHYWRVRIVYQGENGEWSQSRSFTTKEQTVTPPPPSNAFVTARNGNFEINGNVFRFSGTNAYYLPNYQKINSRVVDNAFDIFEETGINVVRMWAFYDGYDCGYSQYDSSENVIQTAPGEYSESALRDLDRVITKGKERGIRFILPFVNYWDELGGICQYNTWAGASNPGRNMEFFLSNSDTQKWYRDYIKMLLNRVNTVTGVAYKDEPAIFAWQIMNEGRNSGADPRILRDWYREIAQLIKSIAPNHMVSTGEEGFDEGTPSEYSVSQYSNTYVLRANEGTSYIMNTSIPEIDFGSAHWYPQDFGFGNNADSNVLNAQRAWLSDHQRIAADLGKPFVLGEWGYAGWGNSTQRTIYDELYEHAESINLDGNLIWQLTADGEKCWEFGGNICYPGGRADTELYNRFRQHVQNIKP